MKNFERIDTPIDGIDSRVIDRDGIAYLATAYVAPDPEQYVDNEIAKIQAGMETPGQRQAVDKMLRPILEREVGLTQ
jgi:hypothetical protein